MKTFCVYASAALLLAGCGDSVIDTAADSQPVETTPVAFNTSGAPTVEYSVPDMMCEFSCVEQVKKTLAAQPGVKDVKVDFEHKLATVAVDEGEFDSDAALAALVDYQFTNTQVVSHDQ